MSQLRHIIERLRQTKVLENYTFMTALNFLSALVALIIYPYVIRVTGKMAYGTYAYALTIAVFFQIVIDFGFYAPCVKQLVEHKNDKDERSRIVSAVLTAKLLIYAACCVVFGLLGWFVPFMHDNFSLCLITFVQVFMVSTFPLYYFQAMKNMKRVTYINLTFRLLVIPFVFLFVHSPQDMTLYALISMLSLALGTLTAYVSLWRDGVSLRLVAPRNLISLYKDGLPFFVTNFTENIKTNILKIVIKNMFGVGEVALYDLADKIVNIPRMFVQNINYALFPEVVDNAQPARVRRILRYERLIGLMIAVLIALAGYPATLLLGGRDMMGAFPLAVVLSGTIYCWLVVEAYLSFVFVPNNRYYQVTKNQFVALFSCLLILLVGLLLWRNIIVVPLALTLSGFAEIAYCRYICRKEKLL